MSVFLCDHLDYHLTVLTDPDGPLKGCNTVDGHNAASALQAWPIADAPDGFAEHTKAETYMAAVDSPDSFEHPIGDGSCPPTTLLSTENRHPYRSGKTPGILQSLNRTLPRNVKPDSGRVPGIDTVGLLQITAAGAAKPLSFEDFRPPRLRHLYAAHGNLIGSANLRLSHM